LHQWEVGTVPTPNRIPSFVEFGEEDDEDEDEDKEDGHGMIRSTASYFRAALEDVAAATAVTVSFVDDDDDETLRGRVQVTGSHAARRRRIATHSAARMTAPRSPSLRPSASAFPALAVRGGAAAAAAVASRKMLVTILVTFVFEVTIGHVIEFLKILMQTSDGSQTYLQLLGRITSEKGLVGIWDGFLPWGVVQCIGKGGVFGMTHAVAQGVLLPMSDAGALSPLVAHVIAGGIAGGFQGYALSPLLLLKTRVMTNPIFREKMSLRETTLLSLRVGADVVSVEGPLAMMKGANVFALKRVFDWGTRFYFSEIAESHLKMRAGTDALPASSQILASLVGGFASTCCTLPLDVLVSQIQEANKAGLNVSAVKMFTDTLETEGWDGLRKKYTLGFIARLWHVALTTAAMKTMVPLVYAVFFSPTEK